MAHNGKIACHFPAAGNPNHDVYGIKFLPVGGNASNLLTIDKVYYLSPVDIATMKAMSSDAERLAYLTSTSPTHRVWELMPSLTAGDTAVAIQYKPTADISVTDIGIFTAESVTDRKAKIKVFHESGLCVAAVDGDSKNSGETLYDLAGDKRDTVINATTLYAGQTYYIVYYGGQNSDYDHKFYPAYFQNSTGKGVYKEYANNLDASQITITEVSENSQNFKPSKFAGVFNSSVGIFGLSENSWFSWHSSQSQWQTGMTNGDIYKRTNAGSAYTFRGIVGDPTDQNHQLSKADMMTMIGLPNDSMFVWYVSNIQGITWNNVYAKVASKWNAPSVTYDGPQDTGNIDLLPGLVALYEANHGTTGNNRALCISGVAYQGKGAGTTIKLVSGKRNFVSSTTPETTLPKNPQIGDVHYFAANVAGGEAGIYALNQYGWYKGFSMYYDSPFENDDSVADWLTLVGTPQDFLTRVGSVPDDNFLAAAENTTRKYYLKINGNEV